MPALCDLRDELATVPAYTHSLIIIFTALLSERRTLESIPDEVQQASLHERDIGSA